MTAEVAAEQRRPGLRWVGRILLGVVAVIAGVLALIWSFQRSLIYFPDNSTVPPAAEVLPAAQDVTLRTQDGLDLQAWFVAADAQADTGLAVLYAPGNGGHRAGRAGIAAELSDRGLAVLLMDYRGYGQNPGRPDEDGLALDALAALAELADQGYPPERVIYLGESLGTGVMARLHTETPPAGLVLRSPFTSLADVGSHHYPFLPVSVLLREEFEVLEHIVDSEVPTVVFYGDADSVVPPQLSTEVAANTANLHAEVRLPGADHNDAVMFGAQLADAVADLADHVTDAS